MATLTTKERDAARFMVLDGAASSEAAHRVVFTLSEGLVHQRRKRPTAAYQRAVAAMLCDFLRAAESDPGRWSYRPIRPSAFTGGKLGYRTFRAAVRDLAANEMLVLAKGHQQWSEDGFGEGTKLPSWAFATRFRPDPWLLRLLAEGGLTPGNWRDHFELVEAAQPLVKDPIVLRRRNVRHRGEKYRGYSMRVDLGDPKARELKDRMDRLNRFFGTQVIEPPVRGFRRIFNNGEAPGFDWNKGGRVYAVGGSYQTTRKAERRQLTINAEAVVEIDVKASFISILSAARGTPLDAWDDPYEIEGLPRPLVKAVVTMTLGHDRLHTRWPSAVKKSLEQELGVKLAKEYPLAKVLPLIVQRLPALAGWGETDFSCFDLQYLESEAIVVAVERLAFNHNVPSLPIHDSLLVPVSQLELAKGVLSDSFEEVTAHRPQLTVNFGYSRGTEKE